MLHCWQTPSLLFFSTGLIQKQSIINSLFQEATFPSEYTGAT